MPKAINGHSQKPTTEQEVDYALSVKMLGDIRDFWMEQATSSTIDQAKLYRLGVIAFSQWASILGVDIGMNVEQFTNVCRANFQAAYDKSPKFG